MFALNVPLVVLAWAVVLLHVLAPVLRNSKYTSTEGSKPRLTREPFRVAESWPTDVAGNVVTAGSVPHNIQDPDCEYS